VAIRFGALEVSEDERSISETNAILLNVPQVGRFMISGGREIVIDPAAGASERHIRLFLLGSAFGVLLHQRGVMPLHANAIEIDGRAIAFSGRSGAGKSTIAAWFFDRGYRILADDVCAIGFDGAGRPLALPGIPRLRLWREALEAGGRTTAEYLRSFDNMEKFDVPTQMEPDPAAIPLLRIYMLKRAEGDGEARWISRITGVVSVNAIVSNTYRGAYVSRVGRTRDHLVQCVRIARAVEVWEVGRPWGFDIFDEQASIIERHALSLRPVA
jgi:hypothetical protein